MDAYVNHSTDFQLLFLLHGNESARFPHCSEEQQRIITQQMLLYSPEVILTRPSEIV